VVHAPDSACEGKGGVLVRFPTVRPGPEEAARANARAAESEAAARRARRPARADSVAPPAGFVPFSQSRASRDTLAPPPEGATLLCGDGSYVVRDTTAVRCQSRGGVRLRLEAPRRP
jgi:hypothetical protein